MQSQSDRSNVSACCTTPWSAKQRDETARVAARDSQALQLCQKQLHEAFAVCHKHPQALRACQKRPTPTNTQSLRESLTWCAPCRRKAYAYACIYRARFGTRHNAWAWQLISPAERPELLNSNFLRVRAVLDNLLLQFLPHGKQVVASLCVNLPAIVAQDDAPTPCSCASQMSSADYRAQSRVSRSTPVQTVSASICKSNSAKNASVAKPRGGYRRRESAKKSKSAGKYTQSACFRAAEEQARQQLMRWRGDAVPSSRRRSPAGTCEARYVHPHRPSCPLEAQRKAGRRVGQNRICKWAARHGQRKRSRNSQDKRPRNSRLASRLASGDDNIDYGPPVKERQVACGCWRTRRCWVGGRRLAHKQRAKGRARMVCKVQPNLSVKKQATRDRGVHSCSPVADADEGHVRACAPAMSLQHRGGGSTKQPRMLQWEQLPELMQAAFLSIDVDEGRFQCLREQTWCYDWEGWQAVEGDMHDEAILAWVERFTRLSAQDETAASGHGGHNARPCQMGAVMKRRGKPCQHAALCANTAEARFRSHTGTAARSSCGSRVDMMSPCYGLRQQNNSAPGSRASMRGGAPLSAGIVTETATMPRAPCFFCDVVCVEQCQINFADQYLCRCGACRRRVCNLCAEQELREFYCPWCVENRVAALEAAQGFARIRACARHHQALQEDRDYTYCAQVAPPHAAAKACIGMVPRAEACSASFACTRPRTGGAREPSADIGSEATLPDLLEAVLLSVLGDTTKVANLLQQTWVKEWHGWRDVADATTDSTILHLGQRLLKLAEKNAAVKVQSNQERLEALRLEGWQLRQGHAHGANNCLLDSLLVALASASVLPRSLQDDVPRRADACAACRAEFVQGPDASLRPQDRDLRGQGQANDQAYLELDRHGPPAATFLYNYITGRPWPRTLAVDVIVYTRFDNADMNPEAWPLRVGAVRQPADAVVRLYNHMDDRGDGYHFDALVATAADAARLPQTSPATPGARRAAASHAADATRNAVARAAAGPGSAQSIAAAGTPSPWADSSAGRIAAEQRAQWAPSLTEMLSALDAFLARRGAGGIRANRADAARAVAAWNRQDELAVVLQTLLQAGLTYSDVSRVTARKVAAEFRGFIWTFHAGAGRTLGAQAADAAAPSKTVAPSGADPPSPCGDEQQTKAKGKRPAQTKGKGGRARAIAAAATAATKKHKAKAPKSRRNRERGASGKPLSRRRQQSPPKPTASKRGGPAAVPAAAKRRRYSSKQPPRSNEPSRAEECMRDVEEDHFVLRTRPVTTTDDPRARADALLSALADQFLEYPTLPQAAQLRARSRAAAQIAHAHCAFGTCGWTGGSEAELQKHVLAAHAACLRPAAAALSDKGADAGGGQGVATLGGRLWDAYRAALDVACQRSAPLACTTLDRRCLREAAQALAEAPPETRVCLLCARRRPFVRGAHSQIWFSRALEEDDDGRVHFLGLTAECTAALLGSETYVERYVDDKAGPRREGMLRDLRDWTCALDFPAGPIKVICCPEDKECKAGCSEHHACARCWIPVCASCREQAGKGAIPKEALANDMVVYYAPRELYEFKVTMLELVCASPCLTSLICFSLEKKYRKRRTLDERVHMQRHRQGARGNATTFLLDWESLLAQFRGYEVNLAPQARAPLPRTGEDLQKFVSVILKTSDTELTPEELSKLIHQARVRRRVVIMLIEKACEREHPAFRQLDLAQVRLRAERELPEDGVPPEVVAVLPCDDNLQQIEKQKVAAPVAAPATVEEAALDLDLKRPNAVVLEKTGLEAVDYEAQRLEAVRALAEVAEEDLRDSGSEQEDGPAPETDVVSRSTPMNQFAPWYFGVAFAYLFQYCTAMPDPPNWGEFRDKRWRRPPEAPHIGLADWVRTMSRRVESQLGRDWTFGYTTWNVLFRSAVNLSRSVYSYDTPVLQDSGEWGKLTAAALENAAIEILRALKGTYATPDGRRLPVNGSLTLAKYATGLSATARRILANMNHTARVIPGTQEARRQMRFEIQGMRVRYGTPIFVTVTPDEGHQLLYIRLSRHRRSDPIRLVEVGAAAAAGDRAWPALDADFTCSLPVECLEPRVPNWEERRRILARDPLATVDGFRVTMLLLLRHLFGMSTCLYCPDCSCGPTPCQDNRGSNAKTNGGVFGRCDAAYVAIEFQKSSGSGHGHIQLFVQCLHQHESLREIFAATSERAAALREAYLHYTSHVRRCIYDRDPVEVTAALHAAEQRWPEYKSERRLISRPRYQAGVMAAENSDEEAELWTEAYLREDVFWLQVLKQHHVHLPDPITGERAPQAGCLKADNPRDCKSGFPRDAEVTDEAAVMCPCRLQARDMPASGRKNCICTLQGPRDEAYLNGTHPAILAFGRCNSDVQLPYRLPYACDVCASPTDSRELQEIVTAAQRAQDAQTGYCCDYCAKTQPMAFAELKELQKGHARLAEQTQGRGVEYQGKRHMTRFLSDAYCKGIVRGQAECCNLRCNYKDGDAACAERITTTQYVTFPGRDFLRYADLAMTGETEHRRRVTAMSLGRSKHMPRQRQLAEREPAEFYARRPRNSACWHLSPYEFLLYWQVVPTTSPTTWQEWKTQPRSTWDVVLTDSGEEKLRAGGGKRVRLVPGKDTRLRVEPSGDTLAFEDIPTNTLVRAAWLLRRRRRPRCPTFGHCPVPRYQQECQEENSKLCMVYFRAWTGMPQHADRDVPHIADLQGRYLAWETAFRAWLQELPCQETKQHVGNFLSVYRVRSRCGRREQ